MIITILTDNPKSWYIPYAQKLTRTLLDDGHDAVLVHNVHEIRHGDLAFFLSCEKIIKKDVRDKNKHSLVVHSSDLPKGKGWSPLTWQVLEGKNKITNTLFEAQDKVDAGDIYAQNVIELNGDELLEDLHCLQGESINRLVLEFIQKVKNLNGTALVGKKQVGEESFYPKRTSADSELDVNKSLKDQFNLLRIVDNEKYPAFFNLAGKKYLLKIYRADN